MDRKMMYSTLRRLIGNPSVNEVAARDLDEWIASAADFLASELANFYTTETQMIGLVADQQEYALPDDLAYILFLEWNDTRLAPSSHFQWDRQGTNYRAATSANPSEFAMYDRLLILNPPPSDDALDTADTLTIRYIAAAPDLTATGIRGLSELDARLLTYEAAYEYLAFHPSDSNTARAQACLTQIQRLLPAAKARAERPILDQSPQFYPQVRRQGAAR